MENQSTPPVPQPIAIDPVFAAFSVLVVDDSRTLRKILIRELNSLGFHNILEAANGLEAIELVKTKPVDLMLLDMEMPELDGLGVLAQLKADATYKALPIIVISGADQFEKTIKCIEIGAEDYLPKPFDPILLRARIFSSLEKKRLRDLDRKHLEMLNHEKQLLEVEQMKTEKLMLNILPRPIAERLKRGEKNISGSYPDVSILFSDLVGFTKMSSQVSATDLVKLLNDLFTRFDVRAESLGLEKIKTIGDAYMAVGGLPIPRPDHAELCADMALGMFHDLQAFNDQNGSELNMRIGINSGPVVAGVIGFTKFSYDLWGNTVNTASRMESTSPHGRVQVSPSTYEALKTSFNFEDGGLMECKGLGEIRTHLLIDRV
ncbi:response regulator [Polynucleobacter paneuropaeus]|jgi:class 3 adenylate cyclase|uniref:Response regulator n=1 Tax=Polynucleobacter paneuropaeus TaxID=2527775 RepID=A0AAE3CGT0_9BURK|nr:adenylate/guanylate cyclase domain-containing protein [Polynucleobacter paneuropaeus]MBT8590185.1 response regulator [Polynucleobacter paneuropaeus]MBT8590445.1 response regulator [Polynucleobacter paneuropaeus]MBT8595821.1 response regulator [Polynucleobacter paneuropaeus]MBT8597648.1 response regulator [Polynucleobacter paneuropaeus]MBT8630862.1 response regulator [Polynucleobacter paneuropaeus]